MIVGFEIGKLNDMVGSVSVLYRVIMMLLDFY